MRTGILTKLKHNFDEVSKMLRAPHFIILFFYRAVSTVLHVVFLKSEVVFLRVLGALEDDSRAGQSRVNPKKPGGRAACPHYADQRGERGAGKSQGEADTRPPQGRYLRRLRSASPPLASSSCAFQSALLEEQKSVMQHCAEERRKLAVEWAHFHAQEKQRHERAEREVSSLLEKREGSIMSLAQVNITMVPSWAGLLGWHVPP